MNKYIYFSSDVVDEDFHPSQLENLSLHDKFQLLTQSFKLPQIFFKYNYQQYSLTNLNNDTDNSNIFFNPELIITVNNKYMNSFLQLFDFNLDQFLIFENESSNLFLTENKINHPNFFSFLLSLNSLDFFFTPHTLKYVYVYFGMLFSVFEILLAFLIYDKINFTHKLTFRYFYHSKNNVNVNDENLKRFLIKFYKSVISLLPSFMTILDIDFIPENFKCTNTIDEINICFYGVFKNNSKNEIHINSYRITSHKLSNFIKSIPKTVLFKRIIPDPIETLSNNIDSQSLILPSNGINSCTTTKILLKSTFMTFDMFNEVNDNDFLFSDREFSENSVVDVICPKSITPDLSTSLSFNNLDRALIKKTKSIDTDNLRKFYTLINNNLFSLSSSEFINIEFFVVAPYTRYYKNKLIQNSFTNWEELKKLIIIVLKDPTSIKKEKIKYSTDCFSCKARGKTLELSFKIDQFGNLLHDQSNNSINNINQSNLVSRQITFVSCVHCAKINFFNLFYSPCLWCISKHFFYERKTPIPINTALNLKCPILNVPLLCFACNNEMLEIRKNVIQNANGDFPASFYKFAQFLPPPLILLRNLSIYSSLRTELESMITTTTDRILSNIHIPDDLYD